MKLYTALLLVFLKDASASSASVSLLATDQQSPASPSKFDTTIIHAGYCLGCTKWPAATSSPGFVRKFSAFIDSVKSRRCARGPELRVEIESLRAELMLLAGQLDEANSELDVARQQRDDLLLEVSEEERLSCEEAVTAMRNAILHLASSTSRDTREMCTDDKPLTSRDDPLDVASDLVLHRPKQSPCGAPGLVTCGVCGGDSAKTDEPVAEEDGGNEKYGIMAPAALSLLALALAMANNKPRGAPIVDSTDEVEAKDEFNLEIEVSDNEDEVSTIGTFTSPREVQPELNIFKPMTAIKKKSRRGMFKRENSVAVTTHEKINVLERLFPFLKPRGKFDEEEVSVMHCGNGIYEW